MDVEFKLNVGKATSVDSLIVYEYDPIHTLIESHSLTSPNDIRYYQPNPQGLQAIVCSSYHQLNP